jgi:hypothetical protein
MTMKTNDNGTNRDMTEEEQKAHESWAVIAQAEAAAQAAAVKAKAAARASALTKLADLGLTDDEISALVG